MRGKWLGSGVVDVVGVTSVERFGKSLIGSRESGKLIAATPAVLCLPPISSILRIFCHFNFLLYLSNVFLSY